MWCRDIEGYLGVEGYRGMKLLIDLFQIYIITVEAKTCLNVRKMGLFL